MILTLCSKRKLYGHTANTYYHSLDVRHKTYTFAKMATVFRSFIVRCLNVPIFCFLSASFHVWNFCIVIFD